MEVAKELISIKNKSLITPKSCIKKSLRERLFTKKDQRGGIETIRRIGSRITIIRRSFNSTLLQSIVLSSRNSQRSLQNSSHNKPLAEHQADRLQQQAPHLLKDSKHTTIKCRMSWRISWEHRLISKMWNQKSNARLIKTNSDKELLTIWPRNQLKSMLRSESTRGRLRQLEWMTRRCTLAREARSKCLLERPSSRTRT